MSKILVVEDADSLREVLTALLENEGFQVQAAASTEAALEVFGQGGYSCVLADFKLPGENGIELLRRIRVLSASTPFILMTAYGSIDIAVEAMKNGANDFLCKPFEPAALRESINQVIKHKRILDRNLGSRKRRDRSFITHDPTALKMLYQAKKVAAVDSSVLILGESGTGKELLARFIHEHSSRKDKPFVAVNCAAFPAELLESEFFGHEAGAFTGATQARPGVFEVSSEGTVFLDEIGDMPASLQVKLLRALQEREIRRVGGSKNLKVNPRVIAATNRNLLECLERGSIREDFYYRLAVMTFEIPALRERPSDIELLVNYYLEHFSSYFGKDLSVDEVALDILKAYNWPGNARELENVIERAVVLADGIITPEHLGISIEIDFDALDESKHSLSAIADRAAKKAEEEVIRRTLERTMGNKSRAAQLLGVSYKTLLNKVREFKLERSQLEMSEF